ncbi:hypothetical protein FW759_12950 [Psychrobacter sp. 1176_08]
MLHTFFYSAKLQSLNVITSFQTNICAIIEYYILLHS